MNLAKKKKSSIARKELVRNAIASAAPVASLSGASGVLIAAILGISSPLTYYLIFFLTSCMVLLGIFLQSRVRINVDNYRFYKDELWIPRSSRILVVHEKNNEGLIPQLKKLTFSSLDGSDRFDFYGCDFVLFDCDTERETAEIQAELGDKLKNANFVIVALSPKIEKCDWIYEDIKKWTSKYPLASCLVFDDSAERGEKERSNLWKSFPFFSDPSKLPWLLLSISSIARWAELKNRKMLNRSIMLSLFFLIISAALIYCLIIFAANR